MTCGLYPCFDITCGKTEKGKEVKWVCGRCKNKADNENTSGKNMRIIEKFFTKTKANEIKFRDTDIGKAIAAIKTLKTLDGLGKEFLVLAAEDKKAAFDIETKLALSNIVVFSCLVRDVTIAFSHDSRFRPPPLPEVLTASKGMITGEQTNSGNMKYSEEIADEIVLPPVPFPEISGKNVCSSSPSQELDKWIRSKINVKDGDATLFLGFDLE